MTTTAQTRLLTPWFVKGSTRVLGTVLAIATLVSLALWALATAQGWAEPAPAVESDGEVIFAFTTSAFSVPLAAVGIAAFVLAIVQTAAYTRPLVASGATRATVAAATLLNGAWMVLLVNVLAAVVLALEVRFAGGWIASTFGVAGGTFADGVATLLRAAGQVSLAVVAGMLIAALFLRWPWWVGVGVLVVILWVIPILAPFVVPAALADTLSAIVAWPGLPAVGVVVLAGAYWVVMKGLRVP